MINLPESSLRGPPPEAALRRFDAERRLVDIDKRADVYPKWMPFIPILSLLAMCLLTQDVFISMSFGIWVGRWMIERDAWIGLLRFLDTDLPEGLAEMARARRRARRSRSRRASTRPTSDQS